MMIDESTIYWLTRVDELKNLLRGFGGAFLAIGAITTIILTAAYVINSSEDVKTAKRCRNWAFVALSIFILGVIFVVGNAFVPTTKQYAMIKVIPAIANNERVQVEFNDWYTLAKDGFKDLVTTKVKEVEKK